MIQRIQTLFLLAVVALSVLMMVLPFQVWALPDTAVSLSLMPGTANGFVSNLIYAPIALNIVTILVSLITIFRFKKRMQQFKLANLIILLSAIITGLLFVASFQKEGLIVVAGSFGIAAFFPILNIIFAFLAARFIKKDETLVRNADRIR